MLKRIVSNTLVNLTGVICKILISVVMTPIIIHALGVEVYGLWVFTLSFSVTGYLSLFSLGITGAVVKFVAEMRARKEDDQISAVVCSAFCVFLALGIVASGLLVAFAHFGLQRVFHIPPQYASVAMKLMTLMAVQALFDFPNMAFSGFLEGLQRYDISYWIDLVRSVVSSVVVYVLLRLGYGVVAMAMVMVGLSALSLLVTGFAGKTLFASLHVTRLLSGPTLWAMVRFSGQMLILRLNAIVYGQMDKFILAVFLTTTVLTDYDVAARFHSLVLVSMGMISSVVLSPSAALNAVGDMPRLRQLFLRGTKFSTAMSLPITFGIAILAGPLLRFWIGPGFVKDTGLVWLFLSYTAFWPLKDVGWNVMIGMGKTAEIVRIQLWTTGLNLMISIVGTPYLGVPAVLWGTLVGNLIAFIFYMRLYLPALNISLRQFFQEVVWPVYGPTSVAAISLLAVITLQPPESLVETALLGASYAALYLLLFAILSVTRQEWGLVRTFCRDGIAAFGLKGSGV